MLKEKEFEIERRSIQLNSPIRNVGLHEFTVRVHSEVSVNMQIKVTGDSNESVVKTAAVEEPKDNNAEETILIFRKFTYFRSILQTCDSLW